MNYDQKEKAKELEKFLSTYSVSPRTIPSDNEAIEEELEWRPSLFLAKVIYLAEPVVPKFSTHQLNEFKNKFEAKSEKQINLHVLFEKFWLRNVLNQVRIAGAVSDACRSFRKIRDFKEELTFLLIHFPDGSNKDENLSKEEFEKIKHNYEHEHNLHLNDIGLYNSNWLSISVDTIEISDIKYYFKPYLDYWDDFDFLSALEKQLSNRENNQLKINKSRLKELHSSFNSFYPKTPTIQALINDKVLLVENDKYLLNFDNSKKNYWFTLSGRIVSSFWQLLIEDVDFLSDEERLREFINKTSFYKLHSSSLKYCIKESKKRFLDAAYTILTDESDLVGIDDELKKISIDHSLLSNAIQVLFHNDNINEKYVLNDLGYFELLQALDRWEEEATVTILLDQSSRHDLYFLIWVIVINDFQNEKEENGIDDVLKVVHYKRIFALLNQSLDKPFLLWQTIQCISLSRKEVLPHLIQEENFTSIGFWLIDSLTKNHSIPLDEKEFRAKKLWKLSIGLAMYIVRYSSFENATKIIFHIYQQLSSKRYRISHLKKFDSLENKLRKQIEEVVLTSIENSPSTNHKIHERFHHYLVPELFNNLVDHFVNLKSKSYHNGTAQFPMVQLSGLAWLMKCSTYWKYKSQFYSKPPEVNNLTNSFLKLYLRKIEITEVNVYNYKNKKEEKRLPLWNEKIERLEQVEWIYPIYFLFKEQNLNSFLEPRIFFNPTKERYNRENNFSADKLRTHIGILLQVLQQMISPTIPYGFKQADLDEIKSSIEQQIIKYIRKHIKNDPDEGRVDLFGYDKEWAFHKKKKKHYFRKSQKH